jgi:hypothetical protein
MADDKKQTAQADLPLADKEAEEVKGGMAYRTEGKKSRKRKKGASAGGGSANAKPM